MGKNTFIKAFYWQNFHALPGFRGYKILGLIWIFTLGTALLWGQNPSAGEIASGWSEMSGGMAGKIVYGEESAEKIYVMDLKTGESVVIGDLELPVPENPGWDQTLCYSLQWSPDGTRISFQNDVKVTVMNADGSNLQVIDTFPGLDDPDDIRHSWDGNDKLVYTDSRVIYSIGVNPDNTAGAKEVVFDEWEPFDAGFSSVGASGKYVNFMDLRGNLPTGGWHRDLVLNRETGVVKDVVEREQDACQFIIKPDGSGTVMYARNNHIEDSFIVTIDVDVTDPNWMENPDWVEDRVPSITEAGGRVLGIQQMAWSNDVNYIVHMGGREVIADMAWIRDLRTKEAVYLGDMVDFPDMYVGEAVTMVEKTPNVNKSSLVVSPVGLGVMQVQVNVAEAYSIKAYGPSGDLHYQNRGTGSGSYHIPLAGQGIYYILVESHSGLRLSKSYPVFQ